MPAGDAFTPRQQDDILRAIDYARSESGLVCSVYVGELTGEPRPRAERLHAALGEAADGSVLVAVDPAARRLEIVTGRSAAYQVDDRSCALAALAMTSAFQAGDLAGGIATGVRSLAEHARSPRTLHTETY